MLQVRALAAATAAALMFLPALGAAQSIGALDVRSRLGERFFAAVPVQTPDGIIDPRCIRVGANPSAPAGAEALQGARVRVGSGDTVVIETPGTVMSPVVGIRLEVGCENPVSRDFVVLGEGANVAGLAPAAAQPAPQIAASEPVAKPSPAPRAQPRRARAPAPARPPVATGSEPAAVAVAPAVPRAAPSPAPVRAPAAETSGVPAAKSGAGVESGSAEAARRVADLRSRGDDHAAALLALDDRLALLQKQAELLKAQLEQVLAAAPASPAAAASGATASAVGSPSTASVSATPSAAVASAAPATPAASAQSAVPTAAPAIASATRASESRTVLDLLTDWKVAGGVAALLLGALALKLRRRPTFKVERSPATTVAWPAAAGDSPPASERTQPMRAQPEPATFKPEDTVQWQRTPVDQTAEWVAPPTTDSLPLPQTEAAPPATLPGAAMTREFHITQQFQPVAERLVALSSPEEIVQQARTHYMDDGDAFKAIDLLEMAVSARKDSVRPWQALFAIYRRENMPERYQRLVLAYRGVFGQDESWPAIRALGYQMDPANPLYGDGPTDEPIPEDLIERWLGVPLDFTAHLLANEMHDQLMDTYSGRRRRKRQG